MIDTERTHLAGDDFALALTSGIHSVIAEQEVLNRINVFPVADGDTGTNLSLSLGAVLGLLADESEKHLGTLLAAVADNLLDSARGNSGAIVAQFFQGMSDCAGDINRFTTVTFGKAVEVGSEYARDALADPKEGTILSAISAFALSVRQQAIELKEENFMRVFEHADVALSAALARTTGQLDVLKKAGVVDAGAMGFVAVISGMSVFIRHGRIVDKPDLSLLGEEAIAVAAGDSEMSTYRFCTECIVTGMDIDRRKLREALSGIGDSLVLAGTKRKAKVHIHVDDPESVFALARTYGSVGSEKADDMHRQTKSSHDAVRRFAVITDSAADIADDDLERFDIHMVPCRIQFGDRGYLDKVSISSEEFYAELAGNPNHPTTSQPAPGDFRRQFQFLATHYNDVLSINLTDKASGTYQAALSAADRVNAPGRIHVIDSKNASLGQGQLVVFAAECAAKGMDIATTRKAIEELIPATRTFALIKDLRYAVKGGRIPTWVKTLADIFRLTPIIRTIEDGRVATGGFLIGRRSRLRRFARYVSKHSQHGDRVRISVGHAMCPDDAKAVADYLRVQFDAIESLHIVETGTAFGVHGGPGTLLVATQPV